MRSQDSKQEIRNVLSCFSGAFSRPSFKIFSCFIVGFIQLGKEVHSSSMVRCLAHSFLRRSLCSFTRFLGDNAWTIEEVAEITLARFFQTLAVKTQSVLFIIVDDTIVRKTGKKIPGCAWHRDHTKQSYVFGHQWVLLALLYKDFLLPLWAKFYHPKGTSKCGAFQTKITIVKRMLQALRFPIACKVYFLADGWYWAKDLVQVCRRCGYHMISQLKSNSVVYIDGQRMKVTSLGTAQSKYRRVSLFLYGKDKTLGLAKFIVTIKALGKVAVVIVKDKRKRPYYLVSTNLHLSAVDVVRYYAKRWKIEQMIKDLKQRFGLSDYQCRNLKAIQRHLSLALLSYCVLLFLKIVQWLKDKHLSPDLSIREWAFHVRKHILLENFTVILKTMRIHFKQNILDTYLEELWT